MNPITITITTISELPRNFAIHVLHHQTGRQEQQPDSRAQTDLT
jgi:hypothetical protein